MSVASELERIRRLNGDTLHAPAVVSWARKNPDSELHKKFEWDDTEAAQKYRLVQAHGIIIQVRVTAEKEDGGKIRVPVWSHMRSERGQGYRLTSEVMSDEHFRAQLLGQARSDLVRVQTKYKELEELSEVIDVINTYVENTEETAG